MTQFNPRRMLEILAKHGVEYVVVGGIGGALHGSPMSTDDVDIVPALKKSNLDSLAAALNEMNAGLLSSEAAEGLRVHFTAKDLQKWIVDFRFLNLSTDYGKLDLIHRPGGTGGFQELSTNAEVLDIGETSVRVAALEDIIRSKQAVARERDLEQLPTLRMLLEQKRATPRIAPGDKVLVPWEREGVEGTVTDVRGVGPAARATVLLEGSDAKAEQADFPLSVLKRLRGIGTGSSDL